MTNTDRSPRWLRSVDPDETGQRRPDNAPALFPGSLVGDEPAEPGTDLAVPGGRVPDVLDGEIVDARRIILPQAQRAVATIRVVTTHRHTKSVARHVLYVAAGATVVGRRLWDGRTTARYERAMRAAEAAGDRESALEWEARAAMFRRDRHARRMDWLALPGKAAVVLPKAAIGLFGLLLGLGVLLAVADHDARQVAVPFRAVADFVKVVVLVVTVAWGPLVLAAPWVLILALWAIGRRHAEASSTGWVTRLQPPDAEAGIVVTADAIVRALQHLGIPQLTKALKTGWVPTFTLPPIRDGRGYQAVFELPLGVTPAMVADRRPVLARNLSRAEIEVWPSDAVRAGTGKAGCVDLWVADAGVLSTPAPEYPLLHEGSADVFAGVPAGVSPRGDQLMVPLVSNNWVTGGMMGQGKSNACRVIMLGAALDPLAELWVHVFAGNGDFDAYRPRLARYERGATHEVAAAGLASLHALYGEVGRRENRLAELGAKKVTRQLATVHRDLRPIIALYSECHELFGHAEYGEEAADIAKQTIRRARKTAIVLGFDTQSSRKEAIPPAIVELVSINSCFAVKSWRSNDGFLGDGSFAAGIRATELRPTTDRGTSLITGVSDASFDLLKWHFVAVDDDTGWDSATDVIARAVRQAAPGTPVQATAPLPVIEVRDLLDDLDEVLDVERVRLADVPALLRDLAPSWGPYRTLNGVQLRALLAEYGVRVTNTGGVPRLDPADLRSAVARQSTADLDEE